MVPYSVEMSNTAPGTRSKNEILPALRGKDLDTLQNFNLRFSNEIV